MLRRNQEEEISNTSDSDIAVNITADSDVHSENAKILSLLAAAAAAGGRNVTSRLMTAEEVWQRHGLTGLERFGEKPSLLPPLPLIPTCSSSSSGKVSFSNQGDDIACGASRSKKSIGISLQQSSNTNSVKLNSDDDNSATCSFNEILAKSESSSSGYHPSLHGDPFHPDNYRAQNPVLSNMLSALLPYDLNSNRSRIVANTSNGVLSGQQQQQQQQLLAHGGISNSASASRKRSWSETMLATGETFRSSVDVEGRDSQDAAGDRSGCQSVFINTSRFSSTDCSKSEKEALLSSRLRSSSDRYSGSCKETSRGAKTSSTVSTSCSTPLSRFIELYEQEEDDEVGAETLVQHSRGQQQPRGRLTSDTSTSPDTLNSSSNGHNRQYFTFDTSHIHPGDDQLASSEVSGGKRHKTVPALRTSPNKLKAGRVSNTSEEETLVLEKDSSTRQQNRSSSCDMNVETNDDNDNDNEDNMFDISLSDIDAFLQCFPLTPASAAVSLPPKSHEPRKESGTHVGDLFSTPSRHRSEADNDSEIGGKAVRKNQNQLTTTLHEVEQVIENVVAKAPLSLTTILEETLGHDRNTHLHQNILQQRAEQRHSVNSSIFNGAEQRHSENSSIFNGVVGGDMARAVFPLPLDLQIVGSLPPLPILSVSFAPPARFESICFSSTESLSEKKTTTSFGSNLLSDDSSSQKINPAAHSQHIEEEKRQIESGELMKDHKKIVETKKSMIQSHTTDKHNSGKRKPISRGQSQSGKAAQSLAQLNLEKSRIAYRADQAREEASVIIDDEEADDSDSGGEKFCCEYICRRICEKYCPSNSSPSSVPAPSEVEVDIQISTEAQLIGCSYMKLYRVFSMLDALSLVRQTGVTPVTYRWLAPSRSDLMTRLETVFAALQRNIIAFSCEKSQEKRLEFSQGIKALYGIFDKESEQGNINCIMSNRKKSFALSWTERYVINRMLLKKLLSDILIGHNSHCHPARDVPTKHLEYLSVETRIKSSVLRKRIEELSSVLLGLDVLQKVPVLTLLDGVGTATTCRWIFPLDYLNIYQRHIQMIGIKETVFGGCDSDFMHFYLHII